MLNEYLSFLFEQEDPRNTNTNQAVMNNPQSFSILGGIKVDLPTFNMFKVVYVNFQNSLKACQNLQDLQNKLCISNVKVDFLRREMEVVRRGSGLCPTQKDPINCQERIRTKITKFNEQIKKEQQKILKIRTDMVVARDKEAQERRKEAETKGLNVPKKVTVG
jgi:hypothetical protein